MIPDALIMSLQTMGMLEQRLTYILINLMHVCCADIIGIDFDSLQYFTELSDAELNKAIKLVLERGYFTREGDVWMIVPIELCPGCGVGGVVDGWCGYCGEVVE